MLLLALVAITLIALSLSVLPLNFLIELNHVLCICFNLMLTDIPTQYKQKPHLSNRMAMVSFPLVTFNAFD